MNEEKHPIEVLDESVNRFGDLPALCIREEGTWHDLTYSELSRRARDLSSWLIESGVEEGDRVAILSENRPEWGVAFFGAIRSGATVVPLDSCLGARELSRIVTDCSPRVLFVSNDQLAKARELGEKAGRIHLIQELDRFAPKENTPSRRRPVDETAVIIYTSGTTGEPKGVMITYQNLLFQVRQLVDVIEIQPGDKILSILPLNHLLELTCGFLGVLSCGGTICFANSIFPHELAEIMQDRKISAMQGVPLLYRSIQSGIEKHIETGPATTRFMFKLAWDLAGVFPWRGVRRLLFRGIHREFGGELRTLVSGGAPLDSPVIRFFERIGIPILQGYGLTETSPAISINTPRANRVGSVGLPLQGVEVKIHDGEILTRGPHVMKGYYHRKEQTRRVIDREGWFHTGDLGRLAPDGFLFVTGRRKTMIVLGGGKKVQPEEIEAELGVSDRIEEICVLGRKAQDGPNEGHEEVCAVVVPAEGASREVIESDFRRLGKRLASFKRPTRIHLFPKELPKTTTRKVKRSHVHKWLEAIETEEVRHA